MIPYLSIGLAANTPTQLTGSDILLRILLVFLLIAINAFFVTAEFSIVSVRQSRINQLALAGDVQAQTVQDLHRSIERLLSTAQLGITLSSLALGWIGESTVAAVLQSWLRSLPLSVRVQSVVPHSIAVLTAFLIIAYLQIVLGELCPKAVALLYPEQLARFLGPPSLAIARIFNPFIWVLNQSTRWLLKTFGIRYSGSSWYNRVSPEELQLIIQNSINSTGLEDEERELLTNVLEFADVSVREVMVPRISIEAIPKDATFQTLLHEVSASGHSRYPVVGNSMDEILGIIYFKELAAPMAQGLLSLESPIAPWIRPAQLVPEHLPLNELLHLMQRSGQSFVIVVDEFGGTSGLVTLKDLASEIIGYSNEPENQQDEPMVKVIDNRTVVVQAQMNLEEVNDWLGLDFPLQESYQTLGGFLIHQVQRIPEPGETIPYEDLELTVTSAVGPRLHQIKIERPAPAAGDANPDNAIIGFAIFEQNAQTRREHLRDQSSRMDVGDRNPQQRHQV